MANKLILALCLLVFISCGTQVLDVDTEANSNNVFSVKKGKKFKVKLAGNPTTGYSWFLLNLKYLTSSKYISNVDTNKDGTAGGYVPSASPNEDGIQLVGSGGYYYYTFKAVAKTSQPVELLFSYQKPWLKNNNDPNAVKVKINVE